MTAAGFPPSAAPKSTPLPDPAGWPVPVVRWLGTTRLDQWGECTLVTLWLPTTGPMALTVPDVATCLRLSGLLRNTVERLTTPAWIAAAAWQALTEHGIEHIRALTATVPTVVVAAWQSRHRAAMYRATGTRDTWAGLSLAARLADAAATGRADPPPVDLDTLTRA